MWDYDVPAQPTLVYADPCRTRGRNRPARSSANGQRSNRARRAGPGRAMASHRASCRNGTFLSRTSRQTCRTSSRPMGRLP
ncbi:hypothetical protein [Henriciella pelagia]|uniref:hypothetical protein n=1 Tax=Henriciella pelagia TaxID=1977912 RepID=UPI003F7E5333